ncbi:MAG: cyclase family protein [Micavibrio sp.]|nr:cyclase family protein [Micavibrio sp.]
MVDVLLTYKGATVQPGQGVDISIPVSVNGVAAFGAAPPGIEPFQAGGFTGSVAAGGSCNCAMYHFSPHLHGTHTEGVGHITAQPVPVHKLLQETLLPATLVTVTPVAGSVEKYTPALQPQDSVITAAALKAALAQVPRDRLAALVIRTTPNGDEKRRRDYAASPAPFLTHDAMHYIAALGVRHLVCDLPSVDRADDDGLLSCHRIFWDAPDSAKTITELAYIPDSVPDGFYILNLQVAAFDGDAAPSRPLLHKVIT